jgi:AraC-like DNA-binding protein
MNPDQLTQSFFASGFIPADIKLVQDLKSLIDLHFKTIRDPEFFSDQLNISLRRLNRLTQHYCKQSVYQMLQCRLHQEAELLLKYTTLSAKEIANELGVCDPAHFNKCFKRITGLCPLEYRKIWRSCRMSTRPPYCCTMPLQILEIWVGAGIDN